MTKKQMAIDRVLAKITKVLQQLDSKNETTNYTWRRRATWTRWWMRCKTVTAVEKYWFVTSYRYWRFATEEQIKKYSAVKIVEGGKKIEMRHHEQKMLCRGEIFLLVEPSRTNESRLITQKFTTRSKISGFPSAFVVSLSREKEDEKNCYRTNTGLYR